MRRLQWLVLSACLLAACSEEIGDPQPWVPWEQIEGPLRPELADPPSPRAQRDPTRPLRVVTYNVERGDDVKALARTFRTHEQLSQAELILVQEIESYPDEPGSRARRLAAELGMGYAYAPARLEGSGTHGDAILSVYPLANLQVMELPHVDFLISDRRRIAMSVDVMLGDQTFHVINVHLDTRLNIQQRILQLRPAIIDAPERSVVGGDFNTNDFVWAAEGSIPQLPIESIVGSKHQALALDDYMRVLGFATPTSESGTTQHTPVLDSRLDSIFVRALTAGPGTVEREVDLSDHWPLWLDLSEPR